MRVLLDSQALLWVLYYPQYIGPRALMVLEADGTELLVSLASIWELGLKHSKTVERQPYSVDQLLQGADALQAGLLEINRRHLAEYGRIKLPHKDPFDTLLVAQSEAEGTLFLTADSQILKSSYHVADITK